MQNNNPLIPLFSSLNLTWTHHGEFYLNSKVLFFTYYRGSSTCGNSLHHTGPLQRGTPSRGRHHICFLHPSLAL